MPQLKKKLKKKGELQKLKKNLSKSGRIVKKRN